MLDDLKYSIPAFVGGLAMLGLLISQLSIKKPDYLNFSVVELQKSIYKFRIRNTSQAKYGFMVVSLWLLTLVPVYLKHFYNISVFSRSESFVVLCLLAFAAIVFVWAFGHYFSKKYEQRLRKAEASLAKVIEFEKTY